MRGQGKAGTRTAHAVMGIVAAIFGIGLAQLLAAFVGASPVEAVGRFTVDHVPDQVKNFAIRQFGSHDKLVLIIGVLVVLLVVAALAGLLYRRRPVAGASLIVLLGVLGALSAAFNSGAGPLDPVPSVSAAILGAAGLSLLSRWYRARASAAGTGERSAEPEAPGGPETPAEPETQSRLHNRRGALWTGAGMLVVGAAGAAGGQLLGSAGGPSTARRLPAPAHPAEALPAGHRYRIDGLSPFVTSNEQFYRVDTALTLPRIDARSWKLRLHGELDHPLELSYDDLLRRSLIEQHTTLCCVSNQVGGPYVSTTRWLGVSLPGLLREAGVHRGADQVLSTSTDGMSIGTPTELIMDGRDALLVVGMNGKPLSAEHGFPVRIMVPGLYGYASATKWLQDIELTSFAAKQAYWVRRGYVKVGTAKTASRIDVPRPFAHVEPGRVTVAGVAWALHRGIAGVEVRVDGGPWHEAQLAADAGPDLWRQWMFTWHAKPGSHQLQVRATDGSGHQQTGARQGVYPSGSTGWHSVSVTVSG